MASYFDEHDCEPLRDGEQPNHLLHLARVLIDTGIGAELQMEFERLYPGEQQKPPAAQDVIANLKQVSVPSSLHSSCPVCLKEFESKDVAKALPCSHVFHKSCITPWLNVTNTCPLCREELPTDDEDYEEFKRQKALSEKRKEALKTLHGSMFT